MVDHELHEALSDCIDRMAGGQSIGDCLRRYPQYAAVLRPMLEVGSLIDRTQAPSYEIASAQARVRAHVNDRLREPPRRRSYVRWASLAASLLIAFAVLFGAAESSLPGDSLYSVKRFTENVRSTLLGEQFAQRRLDEVRTLEGLKRPVNAEFSGQVEQIAGTHWLISGIDVQVPAETVGAASAAVGDTIHVSAYVTDHGDVVALHLTLLDKAVVPLISTATPTPTFVPTSTPSPTTPTPLPITCTSTMPVGWVHYVVQSGDTISGLAAASGASVAQLLAVNCLPPSQMILVGQMLFLPVLPPSTPTPAPPLSTQESVGAGQPIAQPTADQGAGGEDNGSSPQSEKDS